jgi:hypothetical protein
MALSGFGCVFVFAFGILLGARGWDMAILALALVTGFVALIPLLVDAARQPEQRQILITMVSMVYGLFLVLPVFTQYFLPNETTPNPLRLYNMASRDIAIGQIATLAGLISLMIGFYSPITRLVSATLPRPKWDWPPAVALAVAMVMLPLGWSIFLGGQFGIFPKAVGSGALGTIASSVFFGISLLTIIYLRHRLKVALILMICVVPPSMLFNFFTGSKRLFLTPAFMIVIGYILMERRIRRSWVIAGVATIVVLYPISEFYRDVILQGYSLRAVEILSDPGRAVGRISGFITGADPGEYMLAGLKATGIRLDALGIATVIVRDTPERVPYQNGRTLALIPISYIPRILWPGKPGVTIGEWVTANYGSGLSRTDNLTDTGPSWIGEFFFNFGWAGVVIGMMSMGILFRVLQDALFWPGAPIPALLAAAVVLYFGARSVQGGLTGPINGIGYSIWPIIVAHLTLRTLGLATPPGGAGRTREGSRAATAAAP